MGLCGSLAQVCWKFGGGSVEVWWRFGGGLVEAWWCFGLGGAGWVEFGGGLGRGGVRWGLVVGCTFEPIAI